MRTKDSEPLFRTPVGVGKPLRPIGVGDSNVFLGSCFAEHVGQRFSDSRLHTLVNPLGVMYNPMSIARLLTTPVSDVQFDYVAHRGMFHTWLGDSMLSRTTLEACRQVTDQALDSLHRVLAEADNLFLTLGTSRYYVARTTSEVVANCHRLPAREFNEADLGTDEVVACLADALEPWLERNEKLRVVFTVSPYRYAKYGMHESRLSKARLLLAVDELQRRHPDRMAYFPAYEIVLDELRDYRFYAEDMLHPSAQAVGYVCQRLIAEWATTDLRTYLGRWTPLANALHHRPLHPESSEFAAFRQQTLEQLHQLQDDYPMLDIIGVSDMLQ